MSRFIIIQLTHNASRCIISYQEFVYYLCSYVECGIIIYLDFLLAMWKELGKTHDKIYCKNIMK